MKVFSEIYKYEIDLKPYTKRNKDPFTVYAVTDSIRTAEKMLRVDYPSVSTYSVSTSHITTLLDKKCLPIDALIFDTYVDAVNTHTNISIHVFVITDTLVNVFKMCENRYKLRVREIEITPLRHNVMIATESVETIYNTMTNKSPIG